MYNLENCSLFPEITEQMWAVYHVSAVLCLGQSL